jgi:transposase
MDVPICVVGKVFKPNEQKVLALNRCLSEFMRAVKFYIRLKDTSKTCHRCGSVKKTLNGEVYRCSVCGMTYSRDLNAAINIAKRLLGQLSEELGGDVNPPNQQMQITAKSLI